MSRINILSSETASKIAAGEVVEQPAAVVKELVENAMDAKASHISVAIKNGGLDLIRVTDDGTGILNEDITKVFLPHATSKIEKIEDLFTIRSLGFRGEALASVAAVSKTLLKSHAKEDADGMEVFMEGGEEKFKKFSPLDQGTIIDVKDLFYNVPARLKFLKTPQREAAKVTEVMTGLALARPDIALEYTANDKLMFRTYGTGELLDVIRTVYNRKIADNVTYFQRDYEGYAIAGYLGNEAIARGSRSQQTILMNGRIIQSRRLAIAVEQAFKSFITINKFPFFVLHLTVDPAQVDVNVHPQKAEVKFTDERLMFHSIFETVHGALRSFYQGNLGFEEGLEKDAQDLAEPISEQTKLWEDPPAVSLPVDLKPRSERPDQIADDSSSYSESPEKRAIDPPPFKPDPGHSTLTDSHRPGPAEGQPDPEGDSEARAKFPPLRIIGQYQKSYLLAELGDTLYLIDQHAAHEKINFEAYMKELLEETIPLQPLMVPEIIELSLDDYATYLDNQAVFDRAGFELEEFGERALSLRAVPLFLSGLPAEGYFKEILDNLKNLGKGTSREVRYLRIATIACKASVRARDELSPQEMDHLVDRLRYLDEPFTCPHGRPTMVRFGLKDIEKMFRRIQ